jgi:hypothetical protein
MLTKKLKFILPAVLLCLLGLGLLLQAAGPNNGPNPNAGPVPPPPNPPPITQPTTPVTFPRVRTNGWLGCIKVDINQDGIVDFDSCPDEKPPRPEWYIHTDRRGAQLP